MEIKVAEQLGDMNICLNRYGSFEKAVEEMVKPIVAPVERQVKDIRAEFGNAFQTLDEEIKDCRR